MSTYWHICAVRPVKGVLVLCLPANTWEPMVRLTLPCSSSSPICCCLSPADVCGCKIMAGGPCCGTTLVEVIYLQFHENDTGNISALKLWSHWREAWQGPAVCVEGSVKICFMYIGYLYGCWTLYWLTIISHILHYYFHYNWQYHYRMNFIIHVM